MLLRATFSIDCHATCGAYGSRWLFGLCTCNARIIALQPAGIGTVQVTTADGSFTVAFHDPIDAISWALHVQLALLEAPWALELLERPQARVGSCPSGRTLFRGLRVRMAINTGVPAEIIVRSLVLHWHCCCTL